MTTQQHEAPTEVPGSLAAPGAGFIPSKSKAGDGEYALVIEAAAVRRLFILHTIYSPAGRRVLLQAGLKPGMRVADFGCGVGAVIRMLAEMVGPSGKVTGIDAHAPQLQQASHILERGLHQRFVSKSRRVRHRTLVYCRFLSLRPDPAACRREMRDILRPGRLLVVEDGDLASATSAPATAIDALADLFTRLGPTRGLNDSLANNLYHRVKAVRFSDPEIEIHQPVNPRGENRFLLKRRGEEAGTAFVSAGPITSDELVRTLADMQASTEDLGVLRSSLARMSFRLYPGKPVRNHPEFGTVCSFGHEDRLLDREKNGTGLTLQWLAPERLER